MFINQFLRLNSRYSKVAVAFQGFILIEVLLATVIASMVSVLLMTSLSQTNKFRQMVDNFANVYGRAALVQQQLSGDISSIFVPLQAEPGQTAETATPPSGQPRQAVLEKVFYATQKNNKLELLTFITTNALQAHWGTTIGKPKPRAVRVVYRLIPDRKHAQSFILTRQEGSEFDFNTYQATGKAPRSYEVIDGIKDIKVEFRALLKSDASREAAEEQKREYKTFKEWDYAKVQEQDKRLPKIPTAVHIHLVLWDSIYKNSTTFVFTPIVVSDVEPRKAGAKEASPVEKTQQPPRQAERPAGQALLPKKVPARSSTLKVTQFTLQGQ